MNYIDNFKSLDGILYSLNRLRFDSKLNTLFFLILFIHTEEWT